MSTPLQPSLPESLPELWLPQGQVLRRDFVGDPDMPTGRTGFTVYIEGQDGLSNLVTGYEGFHLGESPDGIEEVDQGVFDLSWAKVAETSPKGTGRELIKLACQEAARRGFEVGRASVHHPRIISILERLHAEGVLGEVRLFEPVRARITTEDLLANGITMSTLAAKAYLEEAVAEGDNGFSENMVACVFGLPVAQR